MKKEIPKWPLHGGKSITELQNFYLKGLKKDVSEVEFMGQIMSTQSLTPPGEHWSIEMKATENTVTFSSRSKNKALDLLRHLFYCANYKFKRYIEFHKEQVRIAAPQSFIDLMVTEMREDYGISPKNKYEYEGIQIVPNHEMSVVLYHIDWHKTNDSDLILKIKLNSSNN